MAGEPSIQLQDVRVEIDSSLEHYATAASVNREVGRLETKIAETKTEIIKWVVGTGIAVGALVVGSAALLVNVIG